MKLRLPLGPSTLVTAAFIGPGTLTTCTLAGIGHGYQLLWVLAFSAGATIVLQEMAARLGWITGQGLGEAIRSESRNPALKAIAFGLVLAAILIGNAAYEAGNLSGAAIGLELLFGKHPFWILLAGGLAFGLLLLGKYRWVERILIALVLVMSVCFLATALVVRPDLMELLRGLRPRMITQDNLVITLGLLGTTVVPYNLFLHASTISKKWNPEASIGDIRRETIVAVLLGVGISMLIVVTAAATRDQLEGAEQVLSAQRFATQLEPLAGGFAQPLMGIGFFAAGLSSALTAPLAAAYALRGLFGWSEDDRHWKFMAVWAAILAIGTLVGRMNLNLIYVIKFAQVANALILPLVGLLLLYLANSRRLMGKYNNGALSNLLGAGVLLLLLALSLSSLAKVYQSLV